MPVSITEVEALKSYIEGVMGRAAHHAGNVNGVALTLVGAILWKKDAEPIEVRAQEGEAKNVLWVHISGQRYAFRYNHETKMIEMRVKNTRGPVLHAFSNKTSVHEIEQIFRAL